MLTSTLYCVVGSDCDVSFSGLIDDSGSYVDDADATAYWLANENDITDDALSSVTMDYVGASNGNYLGTFNAAFTATLTANTRNYVRFVATSGDSTWTDVAKVIVIVGTGT